MKIAKNFPTSVTKEKHDDIMAFVTINEIEIVLSFYKNDKSLGSDGIPIEFY